MLRETEVILKMQKNIGFILCLIAFLCTMIFSPITSLAADDVQELLDFLKTDAPPPEPLLPSDVAVADSFKPGSGNSVGEAQLIQGTVLVIHKDSKTAFKLKKGLAVFNGDTLITETRSRAHLLLNDKSTLALAAHSKLVIDKSLYDPKADSRDTEMRLLFGRVRSVVSKVGTSPNYSIKTPTAVAGVRGTDFALAVTMAPEPETSALDHFLALLSPREAHAIVPKALATSVITGANSVVAFSGRTGPPRIIRSHSFSRAFHGRPPSIPRFVGPAAANRALGAVAPRIAYMSMPPGFD